MALFGKKLSTLEEVKKAYEDLSDEDKKAFTQSLSDRVHESVAAQKEEHGQTDEQSAAAREHEALGEEHAEGKGDTEEKGEKDDTPEEKAEGKADEAKAEEPETKPEPEKSADPEKAEEPDRLAVLESKIAELEKRMTDKAEYKDKLEEKKEKYGLNSSEPTAPDRTEVYDEKHIDKLLGK